MSYDFFFLRLADGVSVDEVNDFLFSDAFDEYMDEAVRREENDPNDVMPLFPARFIDMAFDPEALKGLLYEACEALGNEETTERFGAMLDECEMDQGMLQICMSSGPHLAEWLTLFENMLRRLEPQRICLFLDETNQIHDGSHAAELGELAEMKRNDRGWSDA